MNQPNVNPETGIRYGVISGNTLDPEVLDQLYQKASADDTNRWRGERGKELLAEVENSTLYEIYQDELDDLIDRQLDYETANYSNDEPNAEIEHDGVKLKYSWLGGAPLIFVLESSLRTHVTSLCSPCVPNAGDLDSGWDPDGYECYDLPSDWLRKEA